MDDQDLRLSPPAPAQLPISLLDAPPDSALSRLTKLAARLLRAPISMISMLDRGRGQFTTIASFPENLPFQREWPTSRTFCQYVAADGAPYTLCDARDEPGSDSILAAAELGAVAYAGVPLFATGGAVIGVLCALDYEPRDWSAEDLTLLQDLAAGVMSEFARGRAEEENARLYAAERVARLETERSAEHISRLYAVTAALAEAQTQEQVASVMVSQGVSALGAYAGALLLCDQDGETLTLVQAFGYSPEVIANWPSRSIRDPFPIAEAIRTGRPVWIPTREELRPRYPGFKLAPTSRTEAIAIIPLLVDDRAVAAIGLSFDQPQSFPEADRAFMLALADQCAQALDRTRLLASLKRELAERQRVERALRDNEARLDSILRSAMDAIITVDSQQRIVRFNHAAERLFGYRAEDLLGQQLDQLIPTRFRAAHRHHLPAFGATGVTGRAMGALTPLAARRSNGTEFPIEAAISHTEVAGERWYTVILRDVSARLAAEAALRASEARFVAFMDHVPVAAWISGEDGVLRYVNASYSRLAGQPAAAIIGRHLRDFFPARNVASHLAEDKAVLQSGRPRETSIRRDRPDGTAGEFIVYRFPLATDESTRLIGGVAIDVTERAAAESQRRVLERALLETQKLESLGVLAGGIAHDFNNLLVAILGNVELALLDLEPEHPAHHSVAQIGVASRRAADLTQQLLAYSGRGRFVVEPLDLNLIVRELALLLRTSVPKGIGIDYLLDPSLPPVEADATQLRQVLMNLVINAAEAMEGMEGQVEIRTELREVDAATLAACTHTPGLPGGRYVVIEVRDRGCGMDELTVSKIFDPFFTSKFAGRGLGMAAVLGIVRGHRGAIRIASAVGAGTTISIFLPPTDLPALPPPPLVQQQRPQGPAATLLVIDDEPEVRTVTARILGRLGYSVILAGGGHEGLAQLAARPDIAGVLLDLTMPVMSGEETLGEIRQLRPDMPVIVVSGYSASEVHTRVDGVGQVDVLQKPFTPEMLREALDRVLTGS